MQELDPEEDAITGINVTPLVDITLVLLIIFMVTARFLTEPAVGVSLPKSTATSAAETKKETMILLTVDANKQIFFNRDRITKAELGAAIRNALKESAGRKVVLRADKSLSHGEVMSILDIVRAEGVTDFGIAVEGR